MEKEKSNKRLIIVVIILTVLLLGAVSYICYDKFMKKEPTVEVNLPKHETTVTDDKVKELYDRLLTKDKSTGLYLKNNVTIENIPEHELLDYILTSYYFDNELKQYDLLEDKGYDYPSDMISGIIKYAPNTAKISSDELANYIKLNFNIDRTLTLPVKDNEPDEYTTHSLLNGIGVVYDKTSKTYIFYCQHRGGESYKGEHKMLRYEQDEDNIYIYDKVVFCVYFEIGRSCTTSIDTKFGESTVASVLGAEEYQQITPSNINEKDVNPTYILENMDDKLNTYKHTFKKAADGQYYWYSAELVK